MRLIIIKLACLIALITMCSVSKACDYPVIVQEGTDCSGVLLSDDQFVEASNNKKKLRLQDLKISELEGLEELYDLRHKNTEKAFKESKAELRWYEIKSNIGYVISFGFGVFVTTLIVRELR